MRRLSLLIVPLFVAAFFVLTRTEPKPVAAEEKAPPAECRWADTPIVLDGAADDAAWKHAQVIENFGQSWLGDNAPAQRGQTKARLLWDRDYLYFFAEMADPDLFADVTKHDGPIWENDTFELFFRPGADKPGYYEFEVNAANAVLDAFFPKRDLKTAINFIVNGDFKVETKVKLRGTLNQRDDRDEGWSVEGRIPWTDFLRAGGRPEPGDEWRYSLCRCNYDKGHDVELTSTTAFKAKPYPEFFHQIEEFLALKFVGPDERTSQPFGIAKRQVATGSTVVGSPEPPPPYRVKRLYPDYAPKYPILAKAIPGTDDLLVISENHPWGATVLSRVRDNPTSKTEDAVELLKTPDGGTAYDFAFHPKFDHNNYLYVGWNGKFDGKRKKKACRITRYTTSATVPLTIDLKSALTILEWESDGHNGAALCFGTDGMLYVTSGDGTSDSDTDEMGQRTDNLLSKVLRIDVDHPAAGKPYSVPKDNPFVGDARFAPETWAYGLRNPWRIAADEKTGHIWVGNNGQDLWEQAYFVRKGENYGWSVTEGGHPFYPSRKAGPTPIVKPTIEHPHSEFRSLTGGIVYHGAQFPDLAGAYLYADYSTGRIWGMKHDGTKPIWHKELATPRLQISGFGVNTRGELLIIDHSPTGGLYTLEPSQRDVPPSTFPRTLSASGLFESVKDHRMKTGIIPYSVAAPFWSDGLHKERWLALPGTEPINYTPTRGWNFPDRTVVVKSFAVDRTEGDPNTRRWVETRFLTKQDGEWFGYTYLWNDAGTDADLVPAAGTDRTFTIQTPKGPREQTWHYPSRTECMVCHSRAANFVLGLCSHQMNKTHDYSGRVDNQLRTFEHLGLLKGLDWSAKAREDLAARAEAKGLKGKEADAYKEAHGPHPGQREAKPTTLLPTTPTEMPRLVDPSDAKQDLTKRAKSWLHTNCAACHVEAGGGNARMELEFQTPLEKMRILDEKPAHTTFELPDARLIAPGAPDRSVLLQRVGRRGKDQMPPLSTHRIDEAGLALLREWVLGLKK